MPKGSSPCSRATATPSLLKWDQFSVSTENQAKHAAPDDQAPSRKAWGRQYECHTWRGNEVNTTAVCTQPEPRRGPLDERASTDLSLPRRCSCWCACNMRLRLLHVARYRPQSAKPGRTEPAAAMRVAAGGRPPRPSTASRLEAASHRLQRCSFREGFLVSRSGAVPSGLHASAAPAARVQAPLPTAGPELSGTQALRVDLRRRHHLSLQPPAVAPDRESADVNACGL